MLPEMVEGTHKKIKMILDCAIVLSNYTLVLSAFGCGAFKNPPEQIAEIFKEELKYNHTFNDVYFSIKPDHNDSYIFVLLFFRNSFTLLRNHPQKVNFRFYQFHPVLNEMFL